MKVSVLQAWAGAIVALVTGILLGMFAEKLFAAGFPEIALGIICICSFVWCTPTCASFPSLLFFDAAAACRSAVLFSFEYSRAFCLPARS